MTSTEAVQSMIASDTAAVSATAPSSSSSVTGEITTVSEPQEISFPTYAPTSQRARQLSRMTSSEAVDMLE